MDLQRFLKAVQVLTGCSVVVLAIYNFITVPLTDFQTVVLNAYLVFFGLILALSGALGASVCVKATRDAARAEDESLPLAGATVTFELSLSAPLIEHLGAEPPLLLGVSAKGAGGVDALLAKARAAPSSVVPAAARPATPSAASLLSVTPGHTSAMGSQQSPAPWDEAAPRAPSTSVGTGLRAIRAAKAAAAALAEESRPAANDASKRRELRAAVRAEAQTIVAAVTQEFELASRREAVLEAAAAQKRAAVEAIASTPSARPAAAPLPATPEERARRRKLLVLHALNATGAYYALKEALKRAISTYVQQSWVRDDAAALSQAFVAQLYSEVLDDAFCALNGAASEARAIERAAAIGIAPPAAVVPPPPAAFVVQVTAELAAVADAEMAGEEARAASLLAKVCLVSALLFLRRARNCYARRASISAFPAWNK